MTKKILSMAVIFSLMLLPVSSIWGQSTQNYENSQMVQTTKILPQDTRVYLRLLQEVSGKRGDAEPGQKVECEVWRDVVIDGDVLIKAGTHALVKVDSVKHANIAGVKGKISLAAFETTAVDGQPVQLEGGYMKAGKSRMAMTISLAAVLFLPLIFIMGKAAVLPEGMVFDAFTGPAMKIHLQKPIETVEAPVINLSKAISGFSAEVLMDNLQNEKEPEYFIIRVETHNSVPQNLNIDVVNGKPLQKPIELEISNTQPRDQGATLLTRVKIKKLAENFQRGINRFEVSYMENGQRIGTEVVLNVQF